MGACKISAKCCYRECREKVAGNVPQIASAIRNLRRYGLVRPSKYTGLHRDQRGTLTSSRSFSSMIPWRVADLGPARAKQERKELPYTVGYILKDRKELWTAEKPTARDALALVEALQSKGEEIKFIKAPAEGEVGVDMLRFLADEEGLPKSSDGITRNSYEIAWALALLKAKSGRFRSASHVEDAVSAAGYAHEVNSWRDGWEQDRLNQLCRSATQKKNT